MFPLPTHVSGARHKAMDPTGPMPSVAHSLFVPDRPLATTAFFCFAGTHFQIGAWTSKPVNRHLFQQQESQSSMAQAFRADVRGAHHEAMDPTGPMPSVNHSLFVPDRPPATAAFFWFTARYLSGRNLNIPAGQQTPASAA